MKNLGKGFVGLLIVLFLLFVSLYAIGLTGHVLYDFFSVGWDAWESTKEHVRAIGD